MSPQLQIQEGHGGDARRRGRGEGTGQRLCCPGSSGSRLLQGQNLLLNLSTVGKAGEAIVLWLQFSCS